VFLRQGIGKVAIGSPKCSRPGWWGLALSGWWSALTSQANNLESISVWRDIQYILHIHMANNCFWKHARQETPALELRVGVVVSLPNPLAHERALALSEAENLSTPLGVGLLCIAREKPLYVSCSLFDLYEFVHKRLGHLRIKTGKYSTQVI